MVVVAVVVVHVVVGEGGLFCRARGRALPNLRQIGCLFLGTGFVATEVVGDWGDWGVGRIGGGVLVLACIRLPCHLAWCSQKGSNAAGPGERG